MLTVTQPVRGPRPSGVCIALPIPLSCAMVSKTMPAAKAGHYFKCDDYLSVKRE